MRRTLWAPLLAIGAAILILVPTTFAVGEPGTTLYAQLGFNRFPNRIAAVDAQLHFLTNGSARLDVQVTGSPTKTFAIRVYVDGTCASPRRWVINRAAGAGPAGPFISMMGNTSTQIPVHPLDLQRVREEIAGNPNEVFALAVATTHPVTGLNYRTCTTFRTAPFPPVTTTTTTAATTTATTTSTTTTRTTTSLSTGTSFSTITSLSTGTATTFGTTATTTSASTITSTLLSTITSGTVTTTSTIGTTTITSLSTGISTTTTGTTTFTTGVTTITTGVTTFTTATTITSTITL